MANEWTMVRLGDLGKIVTGKTPLTHIDSHYGGTIPFVSPRDMDGTRTIFSTERTLTESGAASVRNAVIPPNAVMVSCIGSDMGKASISGQRCVTNQQINSIIVDDRFDYQYVYYNLSTRKEEIRSLASGSAQPILNKGHFSEITIQVPPLPEQRAIAHVLGTLDDKIECDRKMNRTLEGIVRALFKSWFIDFDPVIDNALAAGKPIPDEFADRAALRQQAAEEHAKPLPDDLRTLFPDEFILTDEIGWIPKGWEVAPLSSIARLKAKTVNPGNSPDQVWVHFSIPAFDDGRQPVYDKGETIKSGKYLVPPYCVLASKLNPQFPRVWLPDVSDPAVSICSTEFMPFVPKTESELPFLYAFLSSEAAQAEITNRVTGSTGSRQRVKPKEIAEMPVLVPPQALRQRLSLTTSRHLDRLLNNMRSIAKLSALRDSLLPKLLSGELPVPLAAMQVEAGGDGDARIHQQERARHHFDLGWKDKVEELA